MNITSWFFDKIVRPLPIRGKYRLLSKFLPVVGVRKAQVFNALMPLRMDELIHRGIFLGSYEFDETRWASSLISKGDVLVDVGANCGYYTLLFSSLVGKTGLVLAVEPNQRLAAELSGLLAANQIANVEVLACGASDQDGLIELFLPPRELGKIYNEDATMAEIDGWNKTCVPIVRLDEIFQTRGLNRVRLLKADIEGHELKALKGLDNHLRKGSVEYLLLELNDYWLKEQGTSAAELVEYCLEVGFIISKGQVPEDGGMSSVLFKFDSGC